MARVMYSDGPFYEGGERSIFLAGPSPRSKEVSSWRPRAVELLKDFNGVVLVPERENPDGENWTYDDQIQWELQGLRYCSHIAFWVDRNLDTLPGFTTNTEFGYWIAKSPERVFYGRPDAAPKNRYLDSLYLHETGMEPFLDLESLLEAAQSTQRTICARKERLIARSEGLEFEEASIERALQGLFEECDHTYAIESQHGSETWWKCPDCDARRRNDDE